MGSEKSVKQSEQVGRSEIRKRFFIALLPPEDVQAEVNKLKGVMRDRYHSKAAFRSPPHITLYAPFEWPVAKFAALQVSLRQFAAARSAFPITLDGFGAFKPHVIYVNVIQSDGLMRSQAELLTHLDKTLGLVNERDHHREFVPHMTIAFRDLKPNQFRQAWSVYQHQPIHFDFTAAQLTLLIYERHQWHIKENYPLAL